mmetsp:Transcript_19334/g.60523  ORF Transcript_19334/g.60523 Transcript_19334/m.60523 type:complete len:263 (+) Transcript_19334:373-1161(+)
MRPDRRRGRDGDDARGVDQGRGLRRELAVRRERQGRPRARAPPELERLEALLPPPLVLALELRALERRRVLLGFEEIRLARPEVGERQLRRGRALEIREALRDGHAADPQRPDDVLLRPVEAVRARRHQQRGRANPRRPPARLDPVALHALHDLESRLRDGVRLVAELELVREAVDVQRRVYERQFEVQQPSKLEERRAQRVDVRLEHVGEVDQQMRRLLAAAHDVQTRADDVERLAALREITLRGHTKKTMRAVHVVRAQS